MNVFQVPTNYPARQIVSDPRQNIESKKATARKNERGPNITPLKVKSQEKELAAVQY